MHLTEVTVFTETVPETASFYECLLEAQPTDSGDGIAVFETDGVDVLVHETYEPAGTTCPRRITSRSPPLTSTRRSSGS